MTRKQIRAVLDVLADKVEQAWLKHEQDPNHGNHAFICPGIGVVGTCTNTAAWLADRLGGEVWGYRHQDNPTAELGKDEFGHDFVTVGRRWLLDFWAKDTYQLPDLYDLDRADDQVLVRQRYGDPARWTRMTPQELDAHLERAKE